MNNLDKNTFLEQNQIRDSILIADQLQYGAILKEVPQGTFFTFPAWEGEICEGVEVLGGWKLDTLKTYKAKKNQVEKYDIKGSMTITSFEEGNYELPDIIVHFSDQDSVVYKGQEMQVKTMPVDTTTFVYHDIKSQIKYPVTFKEVLPYGLGLLALVLLIVFGVKFIKSYLKRKREEEAYKEPAHIVALRMLDKYKGDKFWVDDKQKIFYSGVTDALRIYIDRIYGISAMEMTTKEIFDELSGTKVPEDLQIDLKELFERADFVKFAKYLASQPENATVLPLAVRFVTATYQEDVEEASGIEQENKTV